LGDHVRTIDVIGRDLALAGLGAVGVWFGSRAADKMLLRRSNRSLPAGRHIVILGGGFAGVGVARELARLLPDAGNAQITLIDQNDFMVFTPMLTEAAGGEIDTRHIVHSLRTLSPRIQFVQGKVMAIDLEQKLIHLTQGNGVDGLPDTTSMQPFGYLVVALGSESNDHGITGIREHSIGMKTLRDAAMVRNRAIALLERAGAEVDLEKRRALLTIVVGGGGYTGVEAMAAINDLVRSSVSVFPTIKSREIRTILVEPGNQLLPEINATGLAAYAQKMLEQRHVEVRLKAEIVGAGEDYVELKGGERLSTHLLIWAGGVRPSALLESLDAPRGEHGGLVVDATCAVSGRPGVWALGDCAEIPDPRSKTGYAPTAQNAMREGVHVARNIVATLRGKAPRPFVYTPIGELALVGRRSGVAKVYGIQFTGLLAWAMWRMIYWAKIPQSSQRVRVLLDWTLDLIFGRNTVDLPFEEMPVHTRILPKAAPETRSVPGSKPAA